MANIGLFISCFYSTLLAVLTHYGRQVKVWYQPDNKYHDEAQFPFNYTREPVLFGEVIITFAIYMVILLHVLKVRIFTLKNFMFFLTFSAK